MTCIWQAALYDVTAGARGGKWLYRGALGERLMLKHSLLCLPLPQAFVYVAALQLLLSASRRSMVAGVCGLIAGVLYHVNFMGIREFRVRGAWLRET